MFDWSNRRRGLESVIGCLLAGNRVGDAEMRHLRQQVSLKCRYFVVVVTLLHIFNVSVFQRAIERLTVPLLQASIAMIRHNEQPEMQWLAYWHDQQQHFCFVTAERLENESWRECLDRELAWQLNVRRGQDYLISSMARMHMEETVFDAATKSDIETTVELYVVDPYGRRGRAAFAAAKDVRWLNNHELRNGRTDDGRAIDAWLVNLLKRADVLARDLPDHDQ